MKLDSYLIPLTKMNSKLIRNLSVRPQRVKLPSQQHSGRLPDIGIDNEFFEHDTRSISNENKNQQVELYQMKKFLHNRRNDQQGKKTTYGIGENICNYTSDKGFIFKIYWELIQL